MKLDATITTAQTVAIFHSLMTAAEKARRIMRLAEDSDIQPAIAADRLNAILRTMNLDLSDALDPAPPVPESLVDELVGACRWAQTEIGKTTRPTPLDNAIARATTEGAS